MLDTEMERKVELKRHIDDSSYIPAPKPSVFQSQANSNKRARPGTLDIYNRAGGTRILKDHLKQTLQRHPEASSSAQKRNHDGLAIDEAILRKGVTNQAQKEQRRLELLGRGLDKETLERLYIKWMVGSDLPFDSVTHEDLRKLLGFLNPLTLRMLPDSTDSVMALTLKFLTKGKQRLRRILVTAILDIHITCHVWTSPKCLRFLAVMGHFTSEKLERQHFTLALIHIQEDHTDQDQANAALTALKDFQITGRLGYFVMNHTYCNDKLIQAVANSLEEDGFYYDCQQRSLRCNDHVVDLAIQAFLFGNVEDDYEYRETVRSAPKNNQLDKERKLGPLGKLHYIIFWIMRSPQRTQAFKELSGGLIPRRANGTRWSSWYEMLDWAIQRIHPAIVSFANNEIELTNDVLSAEDWKTLGYIRDFLNDIRGAIKTIEGREATLDRTIPVMDFLMYLFEKYSSQFSEHDFMRQSIQTGYAKLLEHWNKSERSPAYIAAIVLDPTIKYDYFREWDPESQSNLKHAMDALWEKNYRPSTDMVQPSSVTPESENTCIQWLHELKAQNLDLRDELERYLGEPVLIRNDRSAMDWWMEPDQRRRLPFLSKMAIDIYSIPAIMPPSELGCVFSGAAKLTTVEDQETSCTKVESIELMELCVKSWFRMGIFN